MRRFLRTMVTMTAAASAVVATAPTPALAGACDATFQTVTTPNAASGDTELEAVDAWSPSNAWAVGSGHERPFSTHWDGADWNRVTVPRVGDSSQLFEVAMAGAHDVWALGTFTDGDGLDRSLAMHRTTGGWAHVATPNIGTGPNSLFRLAVVGPHDVWAAGNASAGGVTRPLVVHWNGTRWSRVAFPRIGDANNFVAGLTAAGPGDVWVVEEFLNAGAVFRAATFHREGGSWHRVPFTQPSPGDVSPRDVLALTSGNIWMAGFYADGASSVPLLEHWDGDDWVQFNGPAPSDFVYPEALAALGPHAVFAFGGYEEGPMAHPLVERFNGAGWAQVAAEDVAGAQQTGFSGAAAAVAGSTRQVWGAGYSQTGDVRHSLVEHACL